MLNNIDFKTLRNDHKNTCQRLFHGRGNYYPGFEHINIDWLAPIILITLYKEVEQDWLQVLATQISEKIPDCQSIQAQYRYGNNPQINVLYGQNISELCVVEDGLKFHIELGKNQNIGLFLDMRNGRNWIRQHSKNKRILNLFAYTCAFSVAAIAGGAKHIFNIDNNKSVLKKGQENHMLNRADMRNTSFACVDLFKSWGKIKKFAPYDIMICDPPSYQHGSVDITRDYKKIVRRIPQLMNPGAIVMLCLNSPALDHQFLHDVVSENCPDCRYLKSLHPPEIFKEAVSDKGLKIQIYRYTPNTD